MLTLLISCSLIKDDPHVVEEIIEVVEEGIKLENTYLESKECRWVSFFTLSF